MTSAGRSATSGRRDGIALNANFVFLFEVSPLGRVEWAVGLIAAALAHHAGLFVERVPPVLQQGRPLSMEQARFVYSATRIPRPGRDVVRVPSPGEEPARHVLVLHRGCLTCLDVVGPDGSPHTLAELAAGLRAVLAGSAVAPGEAVAHLTTLAREDCAARREQLFAVHPGNAVALEEVETALFCVCLDDVVPADVHAACDQLLHGDSANRWFDKALSWRSPTGRPA